jgi:mannose-6-phosphate isomerase-like protein (cupin superfamily)
MKQKTDSRSNALLLATALLLAIMAGCDGQTDSRQASSTHIAMEDMGGNPWVLDIEDATLDNSNYRHVQWTGEFMQMVLMSLKPGEIIDLEMHAEIDQFIRIEQGEARVLMGESSDNLTFDERVSDDWAVFIPAGYWHEVRNIGNNDLKLYTIYSPAEHPDGTLNRTYEEAVEYHLEHHDHH